MRSNEPPEGGARGAAPTPPGPGEGEPSAGRPRRRRAGLDSSGRPSRERRRFRWRRLLRTGVGVAAAAIAILGGLVAYAALTLPSVDAIGTATGTIRIVDRSGRLLAEVGHHGETRESVPINQIAPIMQEAIIAAEDRNFYSEGAFDPARILKALVVDVILRRPAQGASTITEQVAKEAFFGQDAQKSVLLKLREALLAQELSGRYSKSQILDMYLNLTYFGQDAYGIQSAAERYFGKPASALDLPEAALLAGLPQAPSADDPYVNPSNAFARMHYVLTALVATGKVSQADAQAVDPLNPDGSPNPAHQAAMLADLRNGSPPQQGPAPHFVQYVEDELPQLLQDDPSALQGALTVTTTLDLTYQDSAVAAIQKGLPRIGGGANNAALLMMDPSNGEVLAWVGSANYDDPAIDGQDDFVTLTGLQPGSSFKPYVYETGFMTGAITPTTILHDTPAESRALGGVQDWDRRYEGDITAADSLLHSRNISTEEAAQIIGMPKIIAFAHQLGVTTPIADNLSSAIGTSATSVLDQAVGYSAFANGGHTVTPQTVLRITDQSGNLLWTAPDPGAEQTQAMTPAQAWQITQILRNYPAYWDLHFRWPTAGKSGTTDSYVDAWYMSYTPSWVVATWVGNTDGAANRQAPMNGIFGTTGPGRFIDEPFIDSLPKPAAFQAPTGSTPTPTPTPTASLTPSASASATPTASPTLTPLGTPTPTPTPPPLGTPSPTPSPGGPTAPPTPGGGATLQPSPGGGPGP
jgi:penicillin-binding protein 1A